MRLEAALAVDLLVVAVFFMNAEAQNATKAGLEESCSTTDDCVSGAECLSNTCKCKDHEICSQKDRAQICNQGSCDRFGCITQSNCSLWAGTECRQTEPNQDKFCMLPEDTGGGGGASGDDEKTQQQKNYEDILKLGGVIVAGGIFFNVLCIALVMSGKCSGDPGSKPLMGRGVPELKRRIPPFLGGTKQPSAPGKGPSTGAPGTQPESYSMGNTAGKPPSDSGASEASMSQVSESVVSGTSGVSEMSGASGASGMSGTSGAEESVVDGPLRR